jgi:hypothetical protein
VLRTKASELRNRILPLSDLTPDLDASIATWKQERRISSAEVTIDGCPFAQRAAPQRDKFQISVHSHERLVLAFWSGGYSTYQVIVTLRTVLGFAVAVLCCCLLSIPAIPQQQPRQDPGNEWRLGLWFDEGISAGLSPNRSLEFEFHQRLDEGASNLFEYFFQGGIGFRLRRGSRLCRFIAISATRAIPLLLRKPPAPQSHLEHHGGPVAAHPPYS